MVLASLVKSVAPPLLGRRFYRDLARAYAALAIGWAVGIGAAAAVQNDLVLLLGGYIAGPSILLALFLGHGAPSKALFLARLLGAYIGWFAFAYLWWFVPSFEQPIASFRFPSGFFVFTLLAALFVAAGMAIGNALSKLVDRLRAKQQRPPSPPDRSV